MSVNDEIFSETFSMDQDQASSTIPVAQQAFDVADPTQQYAPPQASSVLESDAAPPGYSSGHQESYQENYGDYSVSRASYDQPYTYGQPVLSRRGEFLEDLQSMAYRSRGLIAMTLVSLLVILGVLIFRGDRSSESSELDADNVETTLRGASTTSTEVQQSTSLAPTSSTEAESTTSTSSDSVSSTEQTTVTTQRTTTTAQQTTTTQSTTTTEESTTTTEATTTTTESTTTTEESTTTSEITAAVSELFLIDTGDDKAVSSLQDGQVVSLADYDGISIEAVATGDTESVEFFVNGSSHRTENSSPYAIQGTTLFGGYREWRVDPGTYTIEAVPYTENSGRGERGPGRKITITITE